MIIELIVGTIMNLIVADSATGQAMSKTVMLYKQVEKNQTKTKKEEIDE
jgi:hypothetical protein